MMGRKRRRKSLIFAKKIWNWISNRQQVAPGGTAVTGFCTSELSASRRLP
jgi:hypothetical protein